MALPALAVGVFNYTQKYVKKVVPGGWYTIAAGTIVMVFITIGCLAAFVGGFTQGVVGGNAKNTVTCEDVSESGGGTTPNGDASEFGGDKAKRNAQGIIDAVAKRGMSDQAAVIALSTAMAESNLKMYWSAKVPGSKELTDEPEAQGSDGYSVGLFQQQVNGNMFAWGTVEDAMNIEKSTFMFLDALKKVPGWESLPVTVAAQRVQVSAFPDAYAKWESTARDMVETMKPSHSDYGEKGDSGSGNGALKPGTTSNTDVFDKDAKSSTGLTVPTDSVYAKDTLRGWSAVIKFWGDQIQTIGGYRSGATAADHGTGKAIDIMIPDYKSEKGKALGGEISSHFVDNQKAYGVTYVIWRNKIWFPSGFSNSGWNDYNGGGLYDPSSLNDTTLHNDHVHVSFSGDAGNGRVTGGSSGGTSGETSGCEVAGQSGNIGVGVGSGKGDDYPYKTSPTWLDVGTASTASHDPWGFFYRECVSFVAWRMNQQMGWKEGEPHKFSKATMNGIGNAADWGPKLSAKGYKLDQTPAKGAIAWWEGNRGIATSSAGHVAVVLEVKDNGQIVVEHYNAVPPHAYSTMTISVNEPSGYIHVADVK